MTGVLSTLAGMGVSLDIQTVSVGAYFDVSSLFTGWSSGFSMGSISDGTFNPKGNASIYGLYYDSTFYQLYFQLVGSPLTNADWTTMKVGSTSYSRSAATFSSTGGYTSWMWSSGGDPFTAVGTDTTVVFT